MSADELRQNEHETADVDNARDMNARDEDTGDVGDDVIDEAQAAVDEQGESEDEVEEAEEVSLAEQLAQVQTRADEYLESLKRERASFQNYKRRVEQERAAQQQRIAGHLLLKLLPIVDDFDRAMAAVPQTERDEWYQGVLLIQRKLEQFLAEQNVTEIEAAGQEFDPNFHEAVGVDSDTEADSGTVTHVLQRGYMQGERVLRPAMVRVAE